ncbi:MAG: phosphate-starvation-inducible PsiE family protein [Pseudomonadota bacterium]|nr:phosphate-starvation-inducible PsiE family protein [Pseudomonadota bacterium]MEC7958013.1 phosphate-starvation-inducible PsiE family protein [Pseudomonadota bacterium]|tara:strand:- start:1163 stop:1588 length:426 start_codon:yes stop_codon:yes gene_type:complete
MDLKFTKIIKGLHWTTVSSERVLLAIIGIATCLAAAQYLFSMFIAREITLADLFLLFIYAEIIGMVGVFYSTNRIPVTLPIIIAITALCRLIIMQGKDTDALMLVGEASAILILSISAYIMSLKDKLSIEKDETSTKEDNI